jgi:hypothetical protein
MKATSWTVFFMFKPLTTIHTTILTESDDLDDGILIDIAKVKIKTELGINIDNLVKRLGENDNFGGGWIAVEQNDNSATEKELEVLAIHQL